MKLKILIMSVFVMFAAPVALAQDQCNTTQQCKNTYGNSATDCKNSQSNNSVCICGSSPCAGGGNNGGGNGGGGKLGKFNKGKDLLLANFDQKPDVDDIHSVACLGTLLDHKSFKGVNYYAVSGASGKQRGQFVPASKLFNLAFGSSRWTSAKNNWNKSVDRAANRAVDVLKKGGSVWVQEAGQSDFTADVVRKIKKKYKKANTKKRVHVVQHSKWNENNTTSSDLNYVRKNTNYKKIADGNKGGNGSPNFKTNSGSNWGKATRDKQSGAIWKEARSVANKNNGKKGHNNKAIKAGGFDFSDCVENAYIFGFNRVGNVDGFFKEFL